MGRKFVDVIGGRDLILSSPSDLARILAVLPNGAPFWGANATAQVGSEFPAIDFVADDWTLEVWFRVSTGVSGNVLSLSTIPIPTLNSQVVWQVYYDSATGRLTFYQMNTSNTTYRSCETNAISGSTSYCVHVVNSVGLSPIIYLNNVSSIFGQVGLVGTPRAAVQGTHKLFVRGGGAAQGVTAPALYKKALSSVERAANIAAMNAA